MSCFLQHPRLPDSPVRAALVSGEFPWLKDALDTLGITAIQTEEERRLPKPVRFHPDLQVSPLYDKQMFVLKRSPLNNQLVRQGFSVSETERCPEQTYPKDVLCGGLVWNSYLIGNPHRRLQRKAGAGQDGICRTALQPSGRRAHSGFLKSQGISAVELRKGPLLDVGGILPLLQGEVERDEKI